MEIPSQKKKKVCILAIENNCVLVLKSGNKWHIPDSHLDWKIGDKMCQPLKSASTLLVNATCGIIGSIKDIGKEIKKQGKRKKILSGGYYYVLKSTLLLQCNEKEERKKIENLENCVGISRRIKKYFKDMPCLELKSMNEIIEINSYENYHTNTIEIIRSYLNSI
jgi:hypothetical protein